MKTTEIRKERSEGKKNETWLFICRGDIIKVNKAFYNPPFRDHNGSPINFYDMYLGEVFSYPSSPAAIIPMIRTQSQMARKEFSISWIRGGRQGNKNKGG